MTTHAGIVPSTAFFMEAAEGQRYCVYHAPNPAMKCRGAMVFVPPFGEEMNKTRRLAAVQSRALASIGFGILQIDLFGCGDSTGELRNATWAIWKQDVISARRWLEGRLECTVGLWGVRLGALLALDVASSLPSPAHLLLWQPILAGKTYLTHLLRIRQASDLVDTGAATPPRLDDLRNTLLSANLPLEIAGYDLTPGMASTFESIDASNFALPDARINWLDIVANPSMSLAPGRAAMAVRWEENEATVQVRMVHGSPFWASPEIDEAPDLIRATCEAMEMPIQ